MKDPIRLSDEGGLSALERELLDAGRTPGRTAAQRKRHAARIAAVAAPVGLGAWLTGPGTAWAWLKAAGGGWLHGGFWIYAGTVLASAAVTLGLALAVAPSEPDVREPEVSEPEVSEPGGPDAHEAHPSEGRSDEKVTKKAHESPLGSLDANCASSRKSVQGRSRCAGGSFESLLTQPARQSKRS